MRTYVRCNAIRKWVRDYEREGVPVEPRRVFVFTHSGPDFWEPLKRALAGG